MGVVRFAIKASVAGGLVYYTVQEGLWSNPEDTIKLYSNIYERVAPYIRDNVPQDFTKELPVIPKASTMTNCAKGMWNNGVMTSVKFVSELPTHMSNGITYVTSMPMVNSSVENVKGLFDAQPESGKTQ